MESDDSDQRIRINSSDVEIDNDFYSVSISTHSDDNNSETEDGLYEDECDDEEDIVFDITQSSKVYK